ncbi:N-acetylglucosamine-6-phosphate deacetylase [Paremcibacter congregatus]|uniref:N-acetylglucosamine-6-phosphate deacetylase n=1 Tax=Paremcibacter congregatus TaxID=2043170 RepID=A0A2G4YQS0_9PROT|nr:N-acetylglucosamine-6-phosphate deacetylase [Paremcibacter congregatus]PHZ84673.1 N-acetylglucosamine-6-phosphate deacetylase [Paremcibacter congregatus]QDE28868.1 N-acetylglucosamine-6-phosphate deacetylase [Paremcibacter congregatus]
MTATGIYAPEILVDGRFVTDHIVLIEKDVVINILPKEQCPDGVPVISFDDGKLVPGFFDIQVNGGGGVLFNDDPSVAAIKAIGAAHRIFGTTMFLPTLISDDLEKIEQAIAAVDAAIDQGVPGVVGIHLEGPFLNAEKKGIHDARKFRRLDEAAIRLLSSLRKGRTLITLAPEMTDCASIAKLAATGVVIAAGHTNATYEQTLEAVKAGVSGFTHLYNAMSPFQSRAPGAVGGAFATTDTFASLIADGFHVHPASLSLAIRTKGVAKTILVTDAMPTVGSAQKEFWLGEERITATGGKCENASGVLAGSDLDMASAVRFIVNNTKYTLEDACAMASKSPASFMKVDHAVGDIKIGTKANFTLLDNNLMVSQTWIDGVIFKGQTRR